MEDRMRFFQQPRLLQVRIAQEQPKYGNFPWKLKQPDFQGKLFQVLLNELF